MSKNILRLLLGGSVLVLLAAIALLSGSSGSDQQLAATPPSGEQQNSEVISSLFIEDSGEQRQARHARHESELDAAGPAHPDNPINPATRRPFSDRQMERFERLRMIFPNNRMIPRRMSAAERKALRDKEAELAKSNYEDTRIKVLLGGLPQSEIDHYFEYRTRFTRDKIQLFRYALDHSSPRADPAGTARLQKLLAQNEAKLERVRVQKQKAYEKSKVQAEAQVW